MYEVVVEKTVLKRLQKIPHEAFKKIQIALTSLASNPRPVGSLKLKGRNGYRIRVGDFRIIYEIVDYKLIVYVIAIAHRKDVYD